MRIFTRKHKNNSAISTYWCLPSAVTADQVQHSVNIRHSNLPYLWGSWSDWCVAILSSSTCNLERHWIHTQMGRPASNTNHHRSLHKVKLPWRHGWSVQSGSLRHPEWRSGCACRVRGCVLIISSNRKPWPASIDGSTWHAKSILKSGILVSILGGQLWMIWGSFQG